MIEEQENEFEVISNISGERVDLTIAPEAMQHIMGLLTNLYSDNEAAPLREYSTNARDSHIEAGIDRPIEVTLPARLAPFLRIKDYGVGLSVKDIHDIYSRYGASTKRDTNEQVGMLGLGCKSALAYTNQFTMVAVKDRVKVQAQISRDSEGSGGITIVDTSATNDPSGVEIIIPAKNVNNFERKAAKFFQYWPKGSVLVNGEEPKHITDNALPITDNIYLVRNYDSSNMIVMGGVPYPADLGSPYGYELVAFVNIGDINFTPSREALQYTAKTKATIERIMAEYHAGVGVAVQKLIDACSSKQEALTKYLEWHDVSSRSSTSGAALVYKGVEFPKSFKLPAIPFEREDWQGNKRTDMINPSFPVVVKNTYRKKDAVQEKSHSIKNWNNTLWFHGFTDAEWSTYKRQKLDQWISNNYSKYNRYSIYVLLKDKPDAETISWLNPDCVVDWKEVAATKIVRAKRSTKDPNMIYGAYDAINSSGHAKRMEANELVGKKLYHWHGMIGDAYNYAAALREFEPDALVVSLASNRIAKYDRVFPESKDVVTAVQDLYTTWNDSLTEDDKLAIALHQNYSTPYRSNLVKAEDFDDPYLSKVITLSKKRDDINIRRWDLFRYCVSTHQRMEMVDPLEPYPLVSSHSLINHDPKTREHVRMYINMIYNSKEKKNG
jgi:hypothetical protein